jgi:hypothetical protein
LFEPEEEPPKRLTISEAVLAGSELAPADEAESGDPRLLSSDDTRELLMLPMADMGFLLSPGMLSDGSGIT